MKTATYTQYFVTYDGFFGYFSQEWYSKYHERYSLSHKKLLPEGELVYGYAQAIEHIEELKKYKYDGKKPYSNTQFKIEIKTTVSTFIDT